MFIRTESMGIHIVSQVSGSLSTWSVFIILDTKSKMGTMGANVEHPNI